MKFPRPVKAVLFLVITLLLGSASYGQTCVNGVCTRKALTQTDVGSAPLKAVLTAPLIVPVRVLQAQPVRTVIRTRPVRTFVRARPVRTLLRARPRIFARLRGC